MHLADAQGNVWTTMTEREARLLLRAWLSPLLPPPHEQLSDLQ